MWYFQRWQSLHWLILPIYSYTDCKMTKPWWLSRCVFVYKSVYKMKIRQQLCEKKRKDKFEHRAPIGFFSQHLPVCYKTCWKFNAGILIQYIYTILIQDGQDYYRIHVLLNELSSLACNMHLGICSDDVMILLKCFFVNSTHFQWNQCR